MSWFPLQSVGPTPTAASPLQATYTSNVSSGTKLIAYISNSYTSGGQITSVKDGGGNSLTLIANVAYPSSEGELAAYAMDTPAGDVGTKPTITAVLANTFGCAILIQEVSGLAAGNTLAAMIDGSAVTNSGAASPATDSGYTSSVAGEYLVGVVGDPGFSRTYTLSGYTPDPSNQGASGDAELNVGYKNSGGAPESFSWAISGAANWGAILVAFNLVLTIITVSLPTASVGYAYSATLAASGGVSPYTWSVSSGSLPGWASLNTSSGVISGTPAGVPTTTSFTVEVTDNAGGTATQPLSLTTVVAGRLQSAWPGYPAPGLFVPGKLIQYGSGHLYTEAFTGLVASAVSPQRKVGRAAVSLVSAAGSVRRSLIRALVVALIAAGVVSRGVMRAVAGLAGVVASAASSKVRLVALSVSTAVYSAVARLGGRSLAGVSVVSGASGRVVSRPLGSTAGIAGVTVRSVSRVLGSTATVTGSSVRRCGRAVNAAGVFAGSLGRGAGRGLTGAVTGGGGALRGVTRLCSAQAAVYGPVIRGVLRAVVGVVVVSPLVSLGSAVTYLVAVIGGLTAAARTQGRVSKFILAQFATLPAVTKLTSRTMTTAIVVTAATVKNIPRVLTAFIVTAASATSIKVHLLTMQAVNAVSGVISRRVLPNMITSLIIESVVTRSVSRAIQGTFAVAGQTLRQAGRVLPAAVTVIVMFSRLPGKLLNASVVVAASAARNLGRFVGVPVGVAAGFTSRAAHFLSLAVKVAVPPSVAALSGKLYRVALTVLMSVSSSAAASFVSGGREIVVKSGVVTVNWVTGALRRRWKNG